MVFVEDHQNRSPSTGDLSRKGSHSVELIGEIEQSLSGFRVRVCQADFLISWAVERGPSASSLLTGGRKATETVVSGPRSHKRIGLLRAAMSAPFAQQPGTPEPPGVPPRSPNDPTVPPPYEDPPRPTPIPRPDQPPDVIDDPPPSPRA
jgi:hypothetical protein